MERRPETDEALPAGDGEGGSGMDRRGETGQVGDGENGYPRGSVHPRQLIDRE